MACRRHDDCKGQRNTAPRHPESHDSNCHCNLRINNCTVRLRRLLHTFMRLRAYLRTPDFHTVIFIFIRFFLQLFAITAR